MKINYEAFRKRMAQQRINQSHLVTITGYSKGAMSDWLRNGKPMPGDAIASIAKSMNMTGEDVAVELLGMKPTKRTISDADIVNHLIERLAESRRLGA